MDFWYVLILPVLILEGSETDMGFFGWDVKEFDFGEKNLFHEVFRAPLGDHSRPRVWKRFKLGVSFVRRQLHDHLDSGGPVQDRTGIG